MWNRKRESGFLFHIPITVSLLPWGYWGWVGKTVGSACKNPAPIGADVATDLSWILFRYKSAPIGADFSADLLQILLNDRFGQICTNWCGFSRVNFILWPERYCDMAIYLAYSTYQPCIPQCSCTVFIYLLSTLKVEFLCNANFDHTFVLLYIFNFIFFKTLETFAIFCICQSFVKSLRLSGK